MIQTETGSQIKESILNSPEESFKFGSDMLIKIPQQYDTTSSNDDVSTYISMEEESYKKNFTRTFSKKSKTVVITRPPQGNLVALRFFSAESLEDSKSLATKLDFENSTPSPRKRFQSTSSLGTDSPNINKIHSFTKIERKTSEPINLNTEYFKFKNNISENDEEIFFCDAEVQSLTSMNLETFSQSSPNRENSNSFDSERLEAQQHEYLLPHEDLQGENWIKVISSETLFKLIEGLYNRPCLIVDCRYGYEYECGHISGAINMTSPEQIKNLFIDNKHKLMKRSFLEALKANPAKALSDSQLANDIQAEEDQPLPILIFHCEFSQKRGPRALKFLRKIDRQYNSFPNITYPEVYLLKGGYEVFNRDCKSLCTNKGNYLPMLHPLYKKHFSIARTLEKTEWNSSNQLSMEFGSLSKSQGPSSKILTY